jgi:hypothetical protein
MKRYASYRVLKSIYVEGLGEFRKGTTAMLSEAEADKFPTSYLVQDAVYLQGFDEDAEPIDFRDEEETEWPQQ